MERVHAVSEIVRQDPDVASVSASVGAGTVNATVNTARLYIVLKPHNQRANAEKIIERLRNATRNVEGISLFMQAAQDLQIDASDQSRTQFQYILQDADAAELADWTPKLVQKLGQLPQLSDVASDQQTNGLQLNVDVDREKASRLNVLTQAIDDTLYDAFGQRQVSIIFTQLNQFRVILEVEPQFRESPDLLDKIYVKSSTRSASAAECLRLRACEQRATFHSPSGSISGSHDLLQFAQWQFAQSRHSGNRKGGTRNRIAEYDCELHSPARRRSFVHRSRASRSSFSPAVVVIYIVLGVLYESYIHPITILSTLPQRGRGRVARAAHLPHRFLVSRAHRHHSAHRHREEERDHDDRFRAGSGTQGRNVAGGVDLSGMSVALSPHHDDNGGGVVRRIAASA